MSSFFPALFGSEDVASLDETDVSDITPNKELSSSPSSDEDAISKELPHAPIDASDYHLVVERSVIAIQQKFRRNRSKRLTKRRWMKIQKRVFDKDALDEIYPVEVDDESFEDEKKDEEEKEENTRWWTWCFLALSGIGACLVRLIHCIQKTMGGDPVGDAATGGQMFVPTPPPGVEVAGQVMATNAATTAGTSAATGVTTGAATAGAARYVAFLCVFSNCSE